MGRLKTLKKEVKRWLKFNIKASKDYLFEQGKPASAINGSITAYRNVLREIEKLESK